MPSNPQAPTQTPHTLASFGSLPLLAVNLISCLSTDHVLLLATDLTSSRYVDGRLAQKPARMREREP